MNKQQGAAALLVVSVLLVAALMMSLGSYKSLFIRSSVPITKLKRGKSTG